MVGSHCAPICVCHLIYYSRWPEQMDGYIGRPYNILYSLCVYRTHTHSAGHVYKHTDTHTTICLYLSARDIISHRSDPTLACARCCVCLGLIRSVCRSCIFNVFGACQIYAYSCAQHSSRTHPPVNMTYQERALNISQSHIQTILQQTCCCSYSFYSSALYICAGCVSHSRYFRCGRLLYIQAIYPTRFYCIHPPPPQ